MKQVFYACAGPCTDEDDVCAPAMAAAATALAGAAGGRMLADR